MSLQVFRLGALSPDAQGKLEDELGNAEGLHVQVLNDLRVLADSGKDVSSYSAALNSLDDRIVTLNTKIKTASNDSMVPQFQEEMDSITTGLHSLLVQTSKARQGVAEGSQLKGLGYGFGAAIAVAVLGYVVWRGGRRRRRR